MWYKMFTFLNIHFLLQILASVVIYIHTHRRRERKRIVIEIICQNLSNPFSYSLICTLHRGVLKMLLEILGPNFQIWVPKGRLLSKKYRHLNKSDLIFKGAEHLQHPLVSVGICQLSSPQKNKLLFLRHLTMDLGL